MKPVVSVIIRAYNAEKYISDAVMSVIRQDFNEPIEIVILFDEGSSTRKALEIAKYIEDKFSSEKRIFKIISHQHMTPFRALLLGISASSGQYVSFLDYDNVYDVEFVKKMVSALRDKKGDVALASLVFTDSSLKPVSERKYPSKFSLSSLFYGNYIDISALMLPRNVLETVVERLGVLNHRYFDWIFEDYLIALVLLREKYKIAYVSDAKLLYRIHETNITYTRSNLVTMGFNTERNIKTLFAYYYLYRNNLSFSEKLRISAGILLNAIGLLIFTMRMPKLLVAVSTVAVIFHSLRSRIERILSKDARYP